MYHPLEEHLLGGQQRETSSQIEPHLVSEYAFGTGSGAVVLHDALVENLLQQLLVNDHLSLFFTVWFQ